MVTIKHDTPPAQARLLAPIRQLDFFDTQSQTLPGPIRALEAWNTIRSQSRAEMRAAFWLRDVISVCFGVKRIEGFSQTEADRLQPGERLDFFLVEQCAPDILTLTARDRHLDVMICICVEDTTVSITSSVITHNTFGRVYMVPVAVVHRRLVGRSLSRLAQSLKDDKSKPDTP